MILTETHYTTAKHYGIDRDTLDDRFYNDGIEFNAIIGKDPVKEKHTHWFQEHWLEWQDRAVVKRGTMYARMKSGMTAEKAALTPSRRKRRWTKEERVRLEEIGVTPHQATSRLAIGWTKEEVLKTPLLDKEQRVLRVREGVSRYHAEKLIKQGEVK